jgi:hypothetical protein
MSCADRGAEIPAGFSGSSVLSQLPSGAMAWDLGSFDGHRGSIAVESSGVVLGYFRPVVRLSSGRFFGWSWTFEGLSGRAGEVSGGVQEALSVAWVVSPSPVVLRYSGLPPK